MICQKMVLPPESLVGRRIQREDRPEVLKAVLEGLRRLPAHCEPVQVPVVVRAAAMPEFPRVPPVRGWFEVQLPDGSAAGMPSPELLAVLVEKLVPVPVGVGS